MKLEEKIFDMIKPMVEEQNIELVDVEYQKEGQDWYLRVYIDKEGSVDLNDCQKISEIIDPFLDKKNLINKRYYLEVSSPGLERVLKKQRDYEKYTGEMIEIKTYSPINGKKVFQGMLSKFDDETLTIEVENNEMVFNRKDIAIAKKTYEF